ncbi:LysR family transcriptional regulator [Brucella pseudogrignonensis]|uniref:LysR family transcriptional regulator n=1 Tax=Brucella pseudogrignonensis TaxID=419475 RepID=UPI001ED9CF67|nr:LysR family transcriptional regulator [Brucella pseudogrignonensis]UKK94687.1 LysR family transcriptional regulator [Brucella pseudogrignonensis]
MDRFDAMRIFVRVVERRSFSLAAEDTGTPRSTVTDAVKQLEARLGVRLLERTTRHVSPTLDGEAYYRRCLSILDDIEDAESAFAGARPRGLLRVDAHGTLARHFLLPGLPAFLTKYPELELYLGEGDRLVDLVREGIDCVLRVGIPQSSDLIARHVGDLPEVTVAAPGYLARYGTPVGLADLQGHKMVGFRASGESDPWPLEFRVKDRLETMRLPTSITVNAAETYVSTARLGLGIIQVPRYHVEADLDSGRLVQILPETPPDPSPVHILYPQNRQLTPRVRVFISWLREIFKDNHGA